MDTALKRYIEERTKYMKRSVARLRGEKNASMFYVLGQLLPRHSVEETLYKYT